MANRFEGLTVADIVVLDDRAAEVLERFGIDTLCEGGRLLDSACEAAGADRDTVRASLDALTPTGDEDIREWPMTRLIQHVLSTHHAYVRSALPVLSADLAALVAAEGERHPQLKRVVTLVQELTNELLQHLAKEEQVLFPYILELDASTAQAGGSPFGTVANPISMMEREHVEATQTVRTIRELTDGYQIPADVGPGYELVMRGLHDFERALRRHIHIENNIVFPKAKDLERHSWQR